MNPVVAVIAMVNGMIGGLILILPILALNGGTVLSFIVISITGFFSYYSCYLCVAHLGSYSDLDKAIFNHFNQSKTIKILYDIMVCVNLVFILLLYFNLIVEQWNGLVGQSIAIPIANAFGLLILVSGLKYLNFGAKLLGYGIISIISYCIFLIWLLATAPSGPKKIPQFGTGAVNLAASMGQAFSIQTFFIPVLRYLPSIYQGNYQKYTLYAYLIGGFVYMYIAFAGSFGIVNRQFINPKLQTIEGYFGQKQWQVNVVQVIYLVHLYSAFGQFLLVSMKRFFGILNTLFGVRISKHGQFFTIPEAIYILGVMVITLLVFYLKIPINDLIQINGAVVGFFFIYLIPALMHFKCLYFTYKTPVIQVKMDGVQDDKEVQLTDRNMSNMDQNGLKKQALIQVSKQNDHNQVDRVTENENRVVVGADSSPTLRSPKKQQINIIDLNVQCECRKPKRIIFQIFDILCVFIMALLGLFIMVDGIISVANSA